jgi:hypothetical protein
MGELNEEQIFNLMNDCLSKLEHSTAEYALQTNPYLSDKDQDSMKAIQAVAAEETALAAELYRLIESMDGIPLPGLPDPLFAEMNYLSFPHLLDIVIRDKEKTAKKHAPRVEKATGFPKVKAFFEKVAASHEDHLKKLKDLRERKYGPVGGAKAAEPASAEPPAPSNGQEAAASTEAADATA